VQRPGILSEIALDLYLLRLITPLQVRISNAVNKVKTSPNDIEVALSLVDEWGRGFVAEVDYKTEAYNTQQFSLAMQRRGLDAVTAPVVIDQYSGSKVCTYHSYILYTIYYIYICILYGKLHILMLIR
jgi:predicted unusual protein kinase regulating ubiquinone biosynthesis (AarF/ABC1/UbiB family)